MVRFTFNNTKSFNGRIQGSLYVLPKDDFLQIEQSVVFKCEIDDRIISNVNNSKIVKKREDESYVYFTVSSREVQKEEKPFTVTNETVEKAARIAALTFTDEQALEVPDLYPVYEVDHAYKKDERFNYNARLFKVNQDHTSAAQWVPGETGTESLYTNLEMAGDGYLVWTQPTGAHNAYNTGDIVHYPTADDPLYKSLIDGNSWSPDAYPAGWELYTGGESSDTETPTEPSEGDDEPETSYPDFVQPTGAHDAYNIGDIVKFNGQLYKSTINNNVWSPDAYPQGWEIYNES